MKAATIYDVAREAGVSIKTVSRVLNREGVVRAENRTRVLEAVAALDYHPSLSARSLAGSKSFIIAAFVDAKLTLEHWRTGRSADYLARVQLGATEACRAAGRHFLLELIDHDPASLKREARDVLSALKPDGVLLTPPSCDDPEMLDLLNASRVRYVRLGAETPLAGGVRLDMDERGGAAAMTRHLLGLGHRRIGFVMGDVRYAASHARLQGFRDELRAAGVEADPALVREGDFTFRSGVQAAQALMAAAEPPTAIFASSDEMALGCLEALSAAGFDTPGDVSVAGYDDSAGAQFSRPPLTTLRQPLAELAAEAVRRLVAPSGEAEEATAATAAPAPLQLVLRRSTGPAP